MPRTIFFMFGGRQANVELQLPYVERILAENPDVEYHIWDLARTPKDSAYLRSISGERISIRTEFAEKRRFNAVFGHYTRREYSNCLFVKTDDDVVFLETRTFPSFIQAVIDNPDQIISAKIINNGACTTTEPELWDLFEQLDIPLLDVHQSAEYAERSHRWFFANWQNIINKPASLLPTDDWLSINLIGYDWEMGRRINQRLNKLSPRNIAGRTFKPANRIGDEGAVNMLPRMIHEGFTAAHLTFGPQAIAPTTITELRKQYTNLGRQYLA